MANQEQIARDAQIVIVTPGEDQLVVAITFPSRFKRFFKHVGKETFQDWMRLYLRAIEGTVVGDLQDVIDGNHTHGLFDHLSRDACQDIINDLDEDGCFHGEQINVLPRVTIELGEKGAKLAKWLKDNGISFPVNEVARNLFVDIWDTGLDSMLSEILVEMEGATVPEEDPTRYMNSLRDAGF